MIAWLMFWKWAARQKCHGTKWCCQYTDRPMCNSWKDPHVDARLRYRHRSREEAKREAAWDRHQNR